MLTISCNHPYTRYEVVSCYASVLFHSEKIKDWRSTGGYQNIEDIKVIWNNHNKDATCIKDPRKQVKLDRNEVTTLSIISGPFTQTKHLRILCLPKLENLDISHGHKEYVAVEADNVEESEGVEGREKKNALVEMFCIFSKTSLFIRYRIWQANYDFKRYSLIFTLLMTFSKLDLSVRLGRSPFLSPPSPHFFIFFANSIDPAYIVEILDSIKNT